MTRVLEFLEVVIGFAVAYVFGWRGILAAALVFVIVWAAIAEMWEKVKEGNSDLMARFSSLGSKLDAVQSTLDSMQEALDRHASIEQDVQQGEQKPKRKRNQSLIALGEKLDRLDARKNRITEE